MYERETVETAYEGNQAGLSKTTKYFYDAAYQTGGQFYGNVSKIEEFDGATLVRTTERWYNTRSDNWYIVDRPFQEAVRDAQGRYLALKVWMYDGQTTSHGVGTGRLTLERQYSNVPLSTSFTGVTLQSTDTSYGYDTYGNRTSVTTYAQPGTRSATGVYSGPGAGSAATTTTTEYDSAFHIFPTAVTPPIAALRETAGYDYRMGTLTSVTDPNGQTTSAEYDAFGRLDALVKPGDSATYPSAWIYYYDHEQPVRYLVAQRERSGQAGARPTTTFYDGLGRLIQTKAESIEGSQNIVSDTLYDPATNTVKESQPRLVDEVPPGQPGATFWFFTPRGDDATMRWSSTQSDALDRPVVELGPDGARTQHLYGITEGLRYHDVVDPNRHRTQWRYDALGRMLRVYEIAGDCSAT